MARKQARRLAPEAIGVKSVSTRSLQPNPHNPRMLFDREPLEVLRASIEKVGILVPLTVYWDKKREAYVILDGQRRWMAATQLDMRRVPVNQVAEPSLVQNIVTMFQIHKLREDWELMPSALKLEVLMQELDETNDARLAELTGLDQAVVTRCKKLLSYSRRFQDLMLDPDPSARVKADFFIELYAVRNDRFVNSMTWFSRDGFTRRMLAKYQTRSGIKAVTDFRLMKQYISNARRAGKKREISQRLREFTNDDTHLLDHLLIRAADVSATARKVISSVNSLTLTLRDLDENSFYGEEALWKSIAELYQVIRRKLRRVGRRLG